MGIVPPEEIDSLDRMSMACPALPLCGLAIGEAERGLPDINRRVRALLQKVGMPDETIVMRMTGCPNGCAPSALFHYNNMHRSDVLAFPRNLEGHVLVILAGPIRSAFVTVDAPWCSGFRWSCTGAAPSSDAHAAYFVPYRLCKSALAVQSFSDFERRCAGPGT